MMRSLQRSKNYGKRYLNSIACSIFAIFCAHAMHNAALAAETNVAGKTTFSPALPSKANPKPDQLHWEQLTPAQQQALAPLSTEWHALPHSRQQKWLRIADRYPRMKPEEQQRLQEQMTAWAKLTPEQRRIARENYRKIEKLQPEKKQEQWQAYQQLPDEKKQALKTPSVVAKVPVAPVTGNVSKSSAAIPTVKNNKLPPKPEAVQKSNRAPAAKPQSAAATPAASSNAADRVTPSSDAALPTPY